MAQVCEITKKRPMVINLVSHANNKVKSRQQLNIQTRSIFVPELGHAVRLKATARGIRVLQKQKNILKYLRAQGVKI